ncbi:GAF domain-containing protein [Capillimicrobium parvum]|uniref:GAF domain-containing protein n=1 Tax=Capillimicrobium parvum TaxID=2884022 RepID=A0A9E6XYE8_9ACTN|nr:GAF domain-containing protein [Capillimicrobium parvum]UGS36857.1 hypothetical protein DSM104329_03268 [Capillimicrobium parvum]
MSDLAVPLESIRACLQGVIPSPLATCAADGTPNVTYLSIVQYVDRERVALSRQFFNKTRANLDANPRAQVRVVDPETLQDFVLDLSYLHTETEGPVFERMRANLDAVASQTGMGEAFRLRGVDVCRVTRSAAVGPAPAAPAPQPEDRAIARLDDFVRRVSQCPDYDDATRVALQALDDLFGFSHAILLVADERGDRLFAVGGNGYPAPSAGAEIAVGEGIIGIAAQRREVVCVPNLARSRAMRAAVRESVEDRGGRLPGREIPLPGLADAQSAAAVPLILRGRLTGALYLESDRPGRFGGHNERLLRIVGGHLATALALLAAERHDAPDAGAPAAAAAGASEPSAVPGTAPLAVTYYQADDSVFVDGEYLVKGVPGRILWRLLGEHARHGRTAFTNRELRLDESLGLPAGADNLEARLLVLRRRLDAAGCGIGLRRTGRGRLELAVEGAAQLTEVPTTGPMRAAHESR